MHEAPGYRAIGFTEALDVPTILMGSSDQLLNRSLP